MSMDGNETQVRGGRKTKDGVKFEERWCAKWTELLGINFMPISFSSFG